MTSSQNKLLKMKKYIIRTVVRTKLSLQSVQKGSNLLSDWGQKYLDLGKGLSYAQASQPVSVPEMLGVDSDMTGWSYYQLLEHNAIVNRIMSLNVKMLMTGEGKDILEQFNPKTDVMPGDTVGSEQVENFQKSIDEHLQMVKHFAHLNSKDTRDHPLFGSFNAHKWHGMISFHLGVHFKQAQLIFKG